LPTEEIATSVGTVRRVPIARLAVSEIAREPTPAKAVRRTEERVSMNQNLAGGAETR
jgi:hypothetical protein